MAKIHIFNPTTGPICYSNDGRIIGGGEHAEVDSLDAHGERAVKRGYIVIMDQPEDETASGDDEAKDVKAKPSGRKAAAKDESSKDSGASDQPNGD